MVKHNMYKTPTYSSWRAMISRCTNPNRPNYYLYGARGIKVCSRWRFSFSNFLQDMGTRPPGYQIDRIDNDGDYEPGNCRWVTPKQNSNNRRPLVDGIMGNRFGSWTPLKKWKQRGVSGELKYECRCICGWIGVVKKKALLRGESSSCAPCANKRYMKKAQGLVGESFNEWLVVSVLDARCKRGRIRFLCRCSCGAESAMVRSQLGVDKSKACRSCSAFRRPRKECQDCGCFGHRGINIELIECELVGFCEICDRFNVEKFITGTKI